MLGFTNIVGNLSPLPELVLWRDPVARSGEEAMAVDEALLEWGRKPVLRAYRWAEPTVTYGYFDEEATARAIFRVRSFILSAAGQGGDCRPSAGYSLYSGHAPQGRKRASFQRGFVPLDSWGAGPRPEGLRGGVRDAGRGCPGRRAGLFSSPVTSDLVLPGGENWLAAAREESAEAFFTRGASRIVFSLPDGMNCWPPAWRKSIPCAWTRNCSPA